MSIYRLKHDAALSIDETVALYASFVRPAGLGETAYKNLPESLQEKFEKANGATATHRVHSVERRLDALEKAVARIPIAFTGEAV